LFSLFIFFAFFSADVDLMRLSCHVILRQTVERAKLSIFFLFLFLLLRYEHKMHVQSTAKQSKCNRAYEQCARIRQDMSLREIDTILQVKKLLAKT